MEHLEVEAVVLAVTVALGSRRRSMDDILKRACGRILGRKSSWRDRRELLERFQDASETSRRWEGVGGSRKPGISRGDATTSRDDSRMDILARQAGTA